MAIKHAILGLLHYKNMHGYRIKSHIENNFGHMWSINYGQIYPNLKSMLEEDLIEIVEMDTTSIKGPNRKLYAITDKGRDEFTDWLLSDPEKNMIIRDPFLMRFVFFGFGDRERALEMINMQIKLYQQQYEMRNKNYKKLKERGLFVRLTAELGLEFNELTLNWLNRAKKEIEENYYEEAEKIKQAL